MQHMGIGYGKLILFGEHSCLYGYPAMVMPLNWKTAVTYTPMPSTTYWKVRPKTTPEIIQLLTFLKTKFPPIIMGEINITSNIPIGVGFGSSAALCVAMTRALLPNAYQSNKFIWEIAHEAEKIFHGTPSGIDTGSATFGSSSTQKDLFVFEKSTKQLLPKIHIIRLPYALPITYDYVPRRLDTKSLVSKIENAYMNNDLETIHHIKSLGQITTDAIELLKNHCNNFLHSFSDKMNHAHHLLNNLSLGSSIINNRIMAAKKDGAFAGKLSGAGGGGAYFILNSLSNPSKQTI